MREEGKAVSNRSILEEVRDRNATIETVQRQKKQKAKASKKSTSKGISKAKEDPQSCASEIKTGISAEDTLVKPVVDETLNKAPINPKAEPVPKKPVPYVRVYEDYEHLRREANSF